MARMTAEERKEQARAEQRTAKVAEFKARGEKERAKRVYSDRAAFAEGVAINDGDVASPDRHLGAMAIYELVHEHESTTAYLRTFLRRMQERMTESLTRLEAGEKASWHSTALGDLPADIEQASTKRDTLASAIARLGWATGWYVPQVMTTRENKRRALFVSLDVVAFAREGEQLSGWVVRSTQDDAKFFLTVVDGGVTLSVEREKAQIYETEEAAWVAAMTFYGDPV